ncbi:extracellular calcium-sensing receptor-like [Hemiscyllium ocellatum]|uniref:extracellular calcium-sensing receptor-like n=1 Tax=Hemiscyllium ocellatum TaxID=170820 RepID=UPI002966C2F3|nr:extracellular calcium-sensing receptor-like [Hemiscyllium ocellatum]
MFNVSTIFEDGDVILAGLFPIHYRIIQPDSSFQVKAVTPQCEGFDFRSFRWVQTMIFAIQEINRDELLLPNIKLGFQIYDTCATHTQSLRAALASTNGKNEEISKQDCKGFSTIPVIVGDSGSTQSMIIQRTLGAFRIPMVSYFASCACLSHRNKFPAFFRTMPSDAHQAQGVAQLVKRFGWTWIGAIAGDDDYGHNGIQAFSDAVRKLGVCIAFTEVIPKIYSRKRILQITETIKTSTARVIVMFAIEGDAYPLIREVVKQNLTGRQWIASEAWVTSALIATKEHFLTLSGTIGFAIPKSEIPGLRSFLLHVHPFKSPNNPFVRELWETLFQCSLGASGPNKGIDKSKVPHGQCTGIEDLNNTYSIYSDVSELRVSYNVYKAIYTIAHALHNLDSCKNGTGFLSNNTCANIFNFKPWQLLHYLKEVRFTTKLGEEIYFNENGDPLASYDIINWHKNADGSIKYVQVGSFNAALGLGNELLINEENIIWHNGQMTVPQSVCTERCPPGTRKAIRSGQPLCCSDCLPCPDGEITNDTDSLNCIPCALEDWSNLQKNQCIPKEIEFLAFDEAMGITLTTVSLLGTASTMSVAGVLWYYRKTPIVRANNSELSFLLLVSLMFCFLCSLTFIGQPSVWSCMLRHTLFGVSFVLCISCVLAKTLVVLVAFRATLPSNNMMKWFGTLQQLLSVLACTVLQLVICVAWLLVSSPFPVKQTKYYNEKIIFECDLGSVMAFSCVLGYIGLLSCVSFVLAFFARKLPDNFNEAKFITFSMLIFCAVWLAFIPAYISSPGKYAVAVEIFAILASSFGLLICIFAPKCYIILLKPERNTKKHLMNKTGQLKTYQSS